MRPLGHDRVLERVGMQSFKALELNIVVVDFLWNVLSYCEVLLLLICMHFGRRMCWGDSHLWLMLVVQQLEVELELHPEVSDPKLQTSISYNYAYSEKWF